jgi:hypothetical protein
MRGGFPGDIAVSESTRQEDAIEAAGATTAGATTAGASATKISGEPEAGPERVGDPAAGPQARAEVAAGAGTTPDRGSKEPKNSFAAVIGNTTLLGALLVYMGWNYENSQLAYFQISAFSLNIGTVEFALKGLVPLFESDVVFFAALLVAVLALASKTSAVRGLVPKAIGDVVGRVRKPADRVMIIGLLLTAVVLPLTWVNASAGTFVGWFAGHRDAVYFVLALLAAGQLLSAWPVRRSSVGPFAYPLALIVAAVCTLWAAGLYADGLGSQAARAFARGLPAQTAVTVYSAASLGLSGPGVTCHRVPGAGEYAYVCTGLRLLYLQSGTYDLLPVGWTAQHGHTFVLDDSDQIRIELSPGS